MVEAEQVQHGRLKVVAVNVVFGRVIGKVVGLVGRVWLSATMIAAMIPTDVEAFHETDSSLDQPWRTEPSDDWTRTIPAE